MFLSETTPREDIREYYLQILFKRGRVVFIPVFMSIFLSLAASLLLPKEYDASTTLLVQEKEKISGVVQGTTSANSLREGLRTIQEQILSWNHLRAVIHTLGMDADIHSPKELEKYIKQVQRKIHVSRKGNDVIRIGFRGKNPNLVQNFVNAITQQYVEKNLGSERQQTYSAIDFLQEQLNEYEKKMKDAKKGLAEFRTQNMNLLSIPQDLIYAEMVKMQSEQEKINIEILTIQQQIQLIEAQLSGAKEIPFAPKTQENPLTEERRKHLADMYRKLSELQLKYTEKHPAVIETIRLIEIEEKRLKEEPPQVVQEEKQEDNPVFLALEQQKKRLMLRLNNLKEQRMSIDEVLLKHNQRIQNIPKAELIFGELTQEVEVSEKMYTQLQERLEQARIAQKLEVSGRGATFEILEPARLPHIPVAPNTTKIILIGLFIGVAVGGGLAYIFESIDHSFRGIADIVQYLNISVLGTIPAIITQHDLVREDRTQMVTVVSVILALISGIFILAWISHLMMKFNL